WSGTQRIARLVILRCAEPVPYGQKPTRCNCRYSGLPCPTELDLTAATRSEGPAQAAPVPPLVLRPMPISLWLYRPSRNPPLDRPLRPANVAREIALHALRRGQERVV